MNTRSCATIAVLLVAGALQVVSASPSVAQTALSAPVLLWASKLYFQAPNSPATSVVDYQSYNHEQVTEHLLHAILKSAGPLDPSAERFLNADLPATDVPDVMLVVITAQVAAHDLSASNAAITPMREALGRAASSLVLPYVYNGQGATHDFGAQVVSSFSSLKTDRPVNVQVTGACAAGAPEEGGAPLEVLTSVLSSHVAGALDVLVVCPSEQEVSLAQEAAAVGAMQAALDSSPWAHVVAVLNDPMPAALDHLVSARRRLLQEGEGDGRWCEVGTVCTSQVRFLEGMILAFVAVVALLSGFACQHVLDTPTRFQMPIADGTTS